MRKTLPLLAGAMIALVTPLRTCAAPQQTTYELHYPSVSADGRIIAFYSQSTNWGLGGYNSQYKVFVYHRDRHKVLNICKNGPYYANSYCDYPRISADGKQVIYEADADNLIGGINTNYFVTNGYVNVYACEIEEGDFSAPAPGFVHKLINVSPYGQQANRGAEYPVCSSNARFVAFQTKAWNLDPDTADTNYNAADIYSGMDIYWRDRDYDGNGVFDEEGYTKTRTKRISSDSDSTIPHCAWYPSISADGQTVAYTMKRDTPGDRPGHAMGVCVYKLTNGSVTVYAPGYLQYTYEPRLSPDATHMVVQSWFAWSETRTIMYRFPNTNWWYVAPRRNNPTGTYVYACEVSAGGHHVVFSSGNTNIAAGDMNRQLDVFLRYSSGGDSSADSFEIASKSTAGVQGDAPSGGDSEYGLHYADVTPDGRWVAFISEATNLVASDTNMVADIFIRDRLSNTTDIVVNDVESPVFPAGAAISVSQLSSNSAYFQWTAAVDEFAVWEYSLALVSASMSTQFVVSGGTACTATGLIPNESYTLTITAFDGAGHHTDPELSTTFVLTSVSPTDGDGDGMADAWEIEHFGSTNAIDGCAGCDPDEDGQNNREEYLLGTNPWIQSSCLRVLSVQRSGTNVAITWLGTTESGVYLPFSLQQNTNPPGGSWETVATNIPRSTDGTNNSSRGFAPEAGPCLLRPVLPY